MSERRVWIERNATAQKLAEEIATELFRNGAGEKARRLVLELSDGRDGGGWCKDDVVDRIATHIQAAINRWNVRAPTDDGPEAP